MILLRALSWPYARKHLLRAALTTFGIALGVAVLVAMHTANERVLLAFSETIDRIAGKTDLQVTAGENGFPEEVLDQVQAARCVAVAVPAIEAVADAGPQGNLLVLGVDMTGDRSLREYDMQGAEDSLIDDPLIFLAQPDSIIVSKAFAQRNALATGSRLTLGTAVGNRAFTVRGVLSSSHLADAFGGNLAVMDIYAAQRTFGRGRTFDRIDIGKKPDVDVEQCEREVATILGAGFDVQPPANRGRQAESMLAGYTVMVNISSAFALFMGMFIVYNSFAVAVAERRKDIGILRALGATRGQIRTLFLGESMLLGIAGSAAGVAFGAGVASLVASAVSRLAGGVYGVAQQPPEIGTEPGLLGLALCVGVGTSLLSALVPAHTAARVDPVQAVKKGTYQALSAVESRFRTRLAAAFAGISVVCLLVATTRPVFYIGYAAAILAALMLGPVLSMHLARALRPLVQWLRPVEGALAADSLIQSPRRTSATVAALMLSLALTVAFGGMARSTYESITGWLDTSLNADLFVMPSQRLDVRTTRFPPSMASELAALPGVGRVQMYRNGRTTFRGRPVMLVAVEMMSVAVTNRRAPVSGDATEMYRRAAAGEGLIVSDSLAQLQGLSLGEVLEVPAPRGAVRLPIVGIVVDYTDQQGAIFIDRAVFIEHWGDESVSDFRVFVAGGSNIGDVARRIAERFAGRRTVFVLSNGDAREYILSLLGQWFRLMNVQIAIAVVVAILGIFTTLTVSITDRRREIGVLQAVGALRNQVRQTIWIEAVVVAVLGLALGLSLGAVNLYYMLQVVQRDIAGFRLDYEFPAGTAMSLVPIVLSAAFVAAIWPAESAVRAPLVEALEYE